MPTADSVFVGSSAPIPKPTDSFEEVAEAVYKKNFELTIKNKTLSVLQKLSDITIQALTVTEVTQQIADIVASELNFSAALIALVDPEANVLKPIALTKSPQILEALKRIGNPFHESVIPLDQVSNLAINALRDKEQKITGNILDLLIPLADQQLSDEIERATHIKTIIIYPLILRDRDLGVLCLGLPKNVDHLSRAEKETLNELIGVVTIAIDRAQLVEHIQKTNDQLQSANNQLELLDKLKDEFVSVASHELRTPMTAIKSYAWMVLNGKSGEITPKAREYLSRIFGSTERLIHLVNEMLDVSRIESGRVKLNKTTFDPNLLCDDIQNEFSAKIHESGLVFTVEKQTGLPVISADREKIQQVLENLIGNSIKYSTKDTHITLVVTKEPSALRFSVTDTGSGISPDDMPRLFKKFGRLENSLVTVTAESSGLGLYISRQYVELHGGTIEATSELGKGSTFTFTLPLE